MTNKKKDKARNKRNQYLLVLANNCKNQKFTKRIILHFLHEKKAREAECKPGKYAMGT